MANDPTGTRAIREDAYKAINAAINALIKGARPLIGAASLYAYTQIDSALSFAAVDAIISQPVASAALFIQNLFRVPGQLGLFSDKTDIVARVFAAVQAHTKTLVSGIVGVSSDWLGGKLTRAGAKKALSAVGKTVKNRLKTLFRTEIVRAYNLTVISKGSQLADTLDKTVKVKWRTRGDSAVRSTHRTRNNVIYTLSRARKLIGEPGCRCGLRLVVG